MTKFDAADVFSGLQQGEQDALQLGALTERDPGGSPVEFGGERAERGSSEYSTNRHLARSDVLVLGYDAYYLVDQVMTQPLQVILAGRRGSTGSYESGRQLWELAPNSVRPPPFRAAPYRQPPGAVAGFSEPEIRSPRFQSLLRSGRRHKLTRPETGGLSVRVRGGVVARVCNPGAEPEWE